MNQQSFFWSDNLKFLRRRRQLGQDELAAALNISRVKLSAHENGHSRNPPIEDLVRFSAFFGISIDNLLTTDLGKLPERRLQELMDDRESYANGGRLRVLATTVDGKNEDNVELVPLKARAGYTAGYGDPEYISKLPLCSLPHLPKGRKYRMFPISGDSMHPVPDGAFIIGEYVEDWTGLKSGTPSIVVTRSEGIVFKLVSHLKETRELRLESLNPAYAPYMVRIEDVLELWRFKSYLSDSLPQAEAPVQEIARAVRELQADIKKLLPG